MIERTKSIQDAYNRSLLFAILLFIVSPILYLLLAYSFIDVEYTSNGQNDIMFYILLIIAVVYPLVIPILEKMQIKIYKNKNKSVTQPKISMKILSQAKSRTSPPENLYVTFFIIKAALIESSFLFGLVVYLTSGDFLRMLYFYPIGIVWVLIYFPTKSKCKKFLEKVSSS